jgi:hypothetical protein
MAMRIDQAHLVSHPALRRFLSLLWRHHGDGGLEIWNSNDGALVSSGEQSTRADHPFDPMTGKPRGRDCGPHR